MLEKLTLDYANKFTIVERCLIDCDSLPSKLLQEGCTMLSQVYSAHAIERALEDGQDLIKIKDTIMHLSK